MCLFLIDGTFKEPGAGPCTLYCALTDFESIKFVKFIANSHEERAIPQMYLSSAFELGGSRSQTPMGFTLLQGLFLKLQPLQTAAPPLALSYFDEPLEITPDDNSEYVESAVIDY